MNVSMNIPIKIYDKAKILSTEKLAKECKISFRQAEFYKKLIKNGELVPFASHHNGRIVGIIGDLHAPFVHPRYIDFLMDTFGSHGVTDIISIGDIVDNHAMSFHDSDPDGRSPGDELKKAVEVLQPYYKAFPKVKVTLGNHDLIPYRKVKVMGLSKEVIKTPDQIWQSPEGWSWDTSFQIDGVLYKHGTNRSGKTPALNLAIRSLQSVVIGHVHSAGGVKYCTSPNYRIFGLDVGCGVDVNAYAFEYGKEFDSRPILGCGIVKDGREAYFLPMPLELYKK